MTAPFRVFPVAPTPRDIFTIGNGIMAGKVNDKGTVTLTASTTTTTVTDNRVGPNSVITLMPITANAAAAIATTYVSARSVGSFTLTHANNAQTDRDFGYRVSA